MIGRAISHYQIIEQVSKGSMDHSLMLAGRRGGRIGEASARSLQRCGFRHRIVAAKPT
jgi:hypothetical protein